MTVSTGTQTTRVKQALARALGHPVEDLAEACSLTDLVAESFALVEAVIRVQEDLRIRLVQEDLREVKTVGDLVGVCVRRMVSAPGPE